MKLDLTELLRHVGNEADVQEEFKVNLASDELRLTRPVKVKLHLTNTGQSVLVDGSLETELELDCSRCLKKFRQPLTVPVDEEYAKNPPRPPAKKGVELELKEKDFVYPIGQDNTLDLDETIRQNILLAVPLKPLCTPACKGEN